ncbi:unnamed protein product [Phaedon cochleariae]|uniref:Fibronectin type-III domain-containing protein n=1 Tax=Phaedon cochleariae TaxID=80249 RepID=A0A9P0DLT7_PHACE|nr:unnamed protein product [Phaedon cochleariae]
MDSLEIVETMKAANSYLHDLESLDNDLLDAVEQIKSTYLDTEKSIQQTFSNIRETLINVLNKREKFLIDKAKKSETDGLSPLQECRSIISNKIESTNKLIHLGNSIIDANGYNTTEFAKNSSMLGSLPEVPELKEVPYLSFHYEACTEANITDVLSQFGEVYRIAPIQITECSEKPGAILIEWKSNDNEERMTDIQEFRLQKAFGDVSKEPHLVANFKDCYRGLDAQFLVKDLRHLQPYSFRVCCKYEGTLEWCPWSLPQVSFTTLKHFSWQSREDYLLSDENKIAKPFKNDAKTLFSDGPQFLVGHSVEFMFLEVDDGNSLVGLICEDVQHQLNDLKSGKQGTFLLNRNGKIFIDGSEKSTILSNFNKGSKVCFTCDLVNKDKMRINIDSEEKRVTYDWSIKPDTKMYFAAQFYSSNWKILVE